VRTSEVAKTRGSTAVSLFVCLIVLLHLPLWAAAAEGDRGSLRASERASVEYLCHLYAIPPRICSRPISVTVARDVNHIPRHWRGFPSYAAGEARPWEGSILIVLSRCRAYPFGNPEQTLRHELSHVLLFRALGFPSPRWLDEGLAMRAGGDWSWQDRFFAVLALPSVANGKWKLSRVERDFRGGEGSVRRSYALAKGFVRDTFPRDEDVTAFVLDARRLRSVDRAFISRFGVSPDRAFREWARNLPWWGEWISWLSSTAILWIVITLLFLLAFVVAVRRRRKKYLSLPD